MEYFAIYERKGNGNLELIGDYRGQDAKDVLEQFTENYGDNYGKVIVMPITSSLRHVILTQEY
jgi:hypothetical protein